MRTIRTCVRMQKIMLTLSTMTYCCVGCTFTYRSSAGLNGTITSPNFPGLYPRNTRCTYVLLIRPKQRLTITFHHFDMEGIMPESVTQNLSDVSCSFGLVDIYVLRCIHFSCINYSDDNNDDGVFQHFSRVQRVSVLLTRSMFLAHSLRIIVTLYQKK